MYTKSPTALKCHVLLFHYRLGGFILDLMVSTYRGLAVFQPVINGVGGNLVSVQSSRLSTELHKETNLGTLPPDAKIMINPISAFCSKSEYRSGIVWMFHMSFNCPYVSIRNLQSANINWTNTLYRNLCFNGESINVAGGTWTFGFHIHNKLGSEGRSYFDSSVYNFVLDSFSHSGNIMG